MTLRDKLLLAIERAENFGACSYRAGCVIAQLADIEDPTGALRRSLSEYTPDSDSSGIWEHFMSRRPDDLKPLREYSLNCLQQMQSIWDNAVDHPDENSARAAMRAYVDSYYPEEA
jgi:hypothetical protein